MISSSQVAGSFPAPLDEDLIQEVEEITLNKRTFKEPKVTAVTNWLIVLLTYLTLGVMLVMEIEDRKFRIQ